MMINMADSLLEAALHDEAIQGYEVDRLMIF